MAFILSYMALSLGRLRRWANLARRLESLPLREVPRQACRLEPALVSSSTRPYSVGRELVRLEALGSRRRVFGWCLWSSSAELSSVYRCCLDRLVGVVG